MDHCKWTFTCDIVQNVAGMMALGRMRISWNQFESLTADLDETNSLPPTANSQIIDKERLQNYRLQVKSD